MNRCPVFVFLAFPLLSLPCLSGENIPLKQVHINSRWGGLGPSAASDLMIVKRGEKFCLDGKTIPSELIKSLIIALREHEIVEPDLVNLGITPEWLTKNDEGPGTEYQGGPQVHGANQAVLYREKFEDPAFVAPLVARVYRSGLHTDDYPSVHVQLSFEDGSVTALSSNSQQPFMLPWIIETDGASHETFNANISRALAALLPKKTVNRPRIHGEGLRETVRESVDQAVEPQLNLLDAYNRAGDALAQLRQQYTVIDAEINAFHHPEYGTEWSGKQPHETNLHAALRKPTFPASVTESLVLRYVDGKVEGGDRFLSTARHYEDLALSVPWFNTFIQDHPEVPVRISYVHDQSLGEKAMRTFTADMKARGRDDVVEEVRRQQAQIVLLMVGSTYGESYWLIFPSRQMMLWRYEGPSGLLKWTAADFPARECANYRVNYGGCSGREVTPDGTLGAGQAPHNQ